MNQNRRGTLVALGLVGTGLIFFGIAGFFLLPTVAAQTSAGPSAIPVLVDFPAPELTLASLSGNPVALSSLRGQVVLVNNWATWCPPCKAEMPALQAYYDAHKDQSFTLVAIEGGEPSSEVAEFARSYQLTFPIWVDGDSKALDAFKNWDIPNSYVIDAAGVIRLAWTGPISRAMLEKYVTPLLTP